MTDISTKVEDYTIEELLTILGNPQSEEEITKASNVYINKYKDTNDKLYNFFINIKYRLLNYQNQLNNGVDDKNSSDLNKQTNRWFEEGTTLSQNDNIQQNRVTDRKQKIDVYANTHNPMNQQQLGISNTFQVPVAQDGKLNPTLDNTYNRLILIDSAYRQPSQGGSNSTSSDFTCDLSDPLKNVLSIKLYSIQIPVSWYNLDINYGNTCFWVLSNNIPYQITIPSGNYNITTFITALIEAFNILSFETIITETNIYYTSTTGRLTIFLDGVVDPAGYTMTTTDRLIFFDFSETLTCSTLSACSSKNNYSFNNTLGWSMGFRNASEPISSSPGNIGQANLNIYGSRYFTLVIDDFNQNKINGNLVTITQQSTNIKLPDYYNTDLPYTCKNFNNVPFYDNLNENNDGEQLAISSEKVITANNIQQILPSAPRTITQAQIYTLNQIIQNNSKTTQFKNIQSNPNDVFAVITIDTNRSSLGNYLIENSSTLQVNKRNYFGPINLSRLRVQLLDNNGNIVNLNGLDFSFTLIAELLYQY